MAKTIPEEDLLRVLVRLRNLRRWAVKRRIDPWAFRQALIIVFELDTEAASRRGVKAVDLESFNSEAREEAKRWLKKVGA